MSENKTVSQIQLAGNSEVYDLADERLREGSFNYEEQNYTSLKTINKIQNLPISLPLIFQNYEENQLFYSYSDNLFPVIEKKVTNKTNKAHWSASIYQNTDDLNYTITVRNALSDSYTFDKTQALGLQVSLPFPQEYPFYLRSLGTSEDEAYKFNYVFRGCTSKLVDELIIESTGERYEKYILTTDDKGNYNPTIGLGLKFLVTENRTLGPGASITVKGATPGIYIDEEHIPKEYILPTGLQYITQNHNIILIKQPVTIYNLQNKNYKYSYYSQKSFVRQLPQYEILTQHAYAVGLNAINENNSEYFSNRSYSIDLDGKEYIIKSTLELTSLLFNGTLVYQGPPNTPIIKMLPGGGLRDINIRIECYKNNPQGRSQLEDFRKISINDINIEPETTVSMTNPKTDERDQSYPVYRSSMPSAFNSTIIEYDWTNMTGARICNETIIENIYITNEEEYWNGNTVLIKSNKTEPGRYYGEALYNNDKGIAGFVTYIPPQSTVIRFKMPADMILQQNIRGLIFKGRAEYGVVIELHTRAADNGAYFNTSLFERIIFESVNCALKTTTIYNGIEATLDGKGILKADNTLITGGVSATPSVSMFTNQHSQTNPVISKPFFDLRKSTHIQGTQIMAWDYYEGKSGYDRVYTLGADNCLVLTDYCYFPGNNPEHLYYSLHRTSLNDYYAKFSNISLQPYDSTAAPLRSFDQKNHGRPLINFVKLNPQDTTDLSYFAKGLQLSQGLDIDTTGLHTIQILHSPQRSRTTGTNFGVYQIRRWISTDSETGKGYWTSTMLNLEPKTIQDNADDNNQLDLNTLGQKLCENHYYYTNSNFVKTILKSGCIDLITELSNSEEPLAYDKTRPYQYVLTCKSVIQGEENEDNSIPYKFLFTIFKEDTSIESFSPIAEKYFYLSGDKQIAEEIDEEEGNVVKKYITFKNIKFNIPSTT